MSKNEDLDYDFFLPKKKEETTLEVAENTSSVLRDSEHMSGGDPIEEPQLQNDDLPAQNKKEKKIPKKNLPEKKDPVNDVNIHDMFDYIADSSDFKRFVYFIYNLDVHRGTKSNLNVSLLNKIRNHKNISKFKSKIQEWKEKRRKEKNNA